MNKPLSILVVKLSAIGDVIHALPVSYAIKETYPDARLVWAVEPAARPLLEGNPLIDEIITFEKKKFKSPGASSGSLARCGGGSGRRPASRRV